MSDLVTVSGVHKASLYAAYGDKRAIYLKALSFYEERLIVAIDNILSGAGPPRDRFERLYRAGIDPVVSGDRSGCFLCSAAADRAEIDPQTGEIVRTGLDRLEQMFHRALGTVFADGSARVEAARHLLAVYVALQSLARAGYPAESLESVLRSAVDQIPSPGNGISRFN